MEGFFPYLAQCFCPLYHLVKKGHVRDWGSGQQAAFEKVKTLVKQIKALGISHAGLPFELDVSVTREVWVGHCDKDNREYS